MKVYRCKHFVEAMCWVDTDANRETFAAWFESHDFEFSTRGPEIVLAESTAAEGTWIVFQDDEFIAMSEFTDFYEEVPPDNGNRSPCAGETNLIEVQLLTPVDAQVNAATPGDRPCEICRQPFQSGDGVAVFGDTIATHRDTCPEPAKWLVLYYTRTRDRGVPYRIHAVWPDGSRVEAPYEDAFLIAKRLAADPELKRNGPICVSRRLPPTE